MLQSIIPAGGKFVYYACSISHLIQPEMDENGLNINTRFRMSKSRQIKKELNKKGNERNFTKQPQFHFSHMNDRNLDVQ